MHIDYSATRYNWAKKRRYELVKNTTKAEGAMKRLLNAQKVDYLFQEIILTDRSFYIVDFVIGKYIIEVDGESHRTLAAKCDDRKRDTYLSSLGYVVIRVKNQEIINNPDQVLYNLLTIGVIESKVNTKQKTQLSKTASTKGAHNVGDIVTIKGSKKHFTILSINKNKCRLANAKGAELTKYIWQLRKK